MDMHPVESSQISHVGYLPDERRLRVQFKNGGIYEYQDVPPETHHALMKAESIGKHFCAHVKPHFKHAKIDPD